jgi:hypothetical protein
MIILAATTESGRKARATSYHIIVSNVQWYFIAIRRLFLNNH